MATTSSALRTLSSLNGAWALVLDGAPIAATTANPATLMSTAWAGTPHAGVVWSAGLHLVGSLEQSINPMDSKVDWEKFSFTITDNQTDTLAGTFLADSSTTAKRALLKADFDNNDTTMTVDSTTGWASSGLIYLGNNAYTYTGTTATTFTGCTPAYDVFTTNGATSFVDFHAIPTDSSGGFPPVSNLPRSWYDRRVALYFHHMEDGAYVTKANAKLVWVGRLKECPKDNGDGSFSFEAWSIKEAFNRNILEDQYQAKVTEGWYLQPAVTNVQVSSKRMPAAGGALTSGDVALTAIPFLTTPSSAALRSVQDMVDGINSQLQTWASTDAIVPDRMVIAIDPASSISGELRYMVQARMPNATDHYECTIKLSASAWVMLGFRSPEGLPIGDLVGTYLSRELKQKGTTQLWELYADGPPVHQQAMIGPGDVLLSTAERGTWSNQPTMPPGLGLDPAGGSANGFVQVGDGVVLAVTRSGSNFTVVRNVSRALASLGMSGSTSENRLYSSGQLLPIRQIWIEHGQVGDMFLKIAASTGTATFNHATNDVYPRTMSIGIPYSLLDPWSWFFLSPAAYWLILTEPTPFLDLFESALAMRNAHLVWGGGNSGSGGASTLRLKRLLGDAPPALADWTLTEANKAGADSDKPDRMTYTRGGMGMVNRCVLKFDADLKGTFRDTATVIDAASVSDYGPGKPIEIKGYGVYKGLFGGPDSGVHDWAASVVSMLRHFGKPITVAERSIDLSLFEMATGDTVAVTDNYAVSPTTGTRGLTTWPGYVLATRANWSDLTKSSCTLGLFMDVDANSLAAWAPSAQVASSVVTASKLVLTCSAHKYSRSEDSADATYFPAGSKCLLFKISEAAGTAYAVEVESQSGNDVTLTTNPAGGALPTTSTWILQFDDIATVVTAQKTKSFIADSADTTTGDSTYVKYLWLGPPSPATASTIDYTVRHRKAVSAADNKGEPMSVHVVADACHSANCLYGYKTSPHYVNHRFFTAVTQTGTTRKLVLPPIWLNLTGGQARSLKCRAHLKTSAGTGTVRFTLSAAPVTGTSDTSLVYADSGAKYGEITTTSTSLEYSSEITISNPLRSFDTGVGGAWLTVDIKATAGDTITLRWVGVREAAP